MGKDEIQRICKGECYNPTDERKIIKRIEVIRIRPQIYEKEELAKLIEDPWKSHTCRESAEGCKFRFTDGRYLSGERDSVYYVRVYQEDQNVINGAQLNCEYDAEGRCIKVRPCKTGTTDNCLAKRPELAWSSPIYVNFK